MFEISNSSASGKHSAPVVLNFPPRSRHRFDILLERERSDFGWLVLTPDRTLGWLHGSFDTALSDAREIARTYGAAVHSSAGRFLP
jgi:hypothetical protein